MVLKIGKKKNNQLLQQTGRNLIANSDPRSPVSEQYRTIRTNIQFSAVDQEIKTLMVTSAGPGEGKSTTVANLAIVFAQQGKKVLLIDADLRKPTIHYTFRQENHTGLTNVLTKQAKIEKAVQKTDIENLYTLTSGPIPPNPAELLGAKTMDEFLETASEQFDLVLFDTPPVLAVTDAQVLSNKCNGAIMVVYSGKTETDAAIKAKELLVAAKAKLLGVVLNHKKQKDSQYYYYYGTK